MDNLRAALTKQFPFLGAYEGIQAKVGGLDIEGMAYDPHRDVMWLGLRGPLVATDLSGPGDSAVLLQLKGVLGNWSSFPQRDDSVSNPILLDLGGFGVRDLYYDSEWDRLFILTGTMQDNAGNLPTHVRCYNPTSGTLTAYNLEIPRYQNGSDTGDVEGITAIYHKCWGGWRPIGRTRKHLLVVYDCTSGVYGVRTFPSPTFRVTFPFP